MAKQAPPSIRILSLSERISGLRNGSLTLPKLVFDSELAKKRLARWRSQSPYDIPEALHKRLSIENVSFDDFEKLLGLAGDPNEPESRDESHWSEIATLWRVENSNSAEMSENSRMQRLQSGFAILAKPSIDRAVNTLMEHLKILCFDGSLRPFLGDTVLSNLLKALYSEVASLTTRTLTLEMHVAKLQGVLTGETPEARYREFMNRLTHPNVSQGILEEYAVLAKLLDIAISGWLDASKSFFSHFAEDWGSLCKMFSELKTAGPLVDLSGGAGDMHCGHRSVHIATFSDGTKLVYKPRSLAIDEHFSEICRWLAAKDASLELRIPEVLAKNDHGWCRFVVVEPCNSRESLERFYFRLGGLLALLYVLQATDFHYENIIAAGEYPTPVDFEAVLHARLDEIQSTTPMDLFRQIQESSVMRVGLLPRRIFAVDGVNEGIDVSGMGGQAGQMSPTMVLALEESPSVDMRMVRQHIPITGSSNLPTLNGTAVQPADFVESLIQGFRAACGIFIEEKGELLSTDGLLQSFSGDTLRLIIRPTMTYAKVLQESYHPNLLRDAVDRDRLLERLWLGCYHSPFLESFFSSEQCALRQGEIPAFFFKADKTGVWSSDGSFLGNLLRSPVIEKAHSEISALDKTEIDEQDWWIRASLACSQSRGPVVNSLNHFAILEIQPSADTFLHRARLIADQIVNSSKTNGEHLHWRGLLYSKELWSCGPVGIDIYNGSAGICLFLGLLGAWTGEKLYTLTAHRALITSLAYIRQLHSATPPVRPLGILFGESGLLYCLNQLGVLWQNESLMREAAQLCEYLTLSASHVPLNSLGSGLAGLVLASVHLMRSSGSAQIRACLQSSAGILLERVRQILASSTEVVPTGALWSEGLHGIGYALYQAGLCLQDQEISAVGVYVLERSLEECLQRESIPSSVLRVEKNKILVSELQLGLHSAEPKRAGFQLGEQVIGGTNFDRGSSLDHGLCSELDMLLIMQSHKRTPAIDWDMPHSRMLLHISGQEKIPLDTPSAIESVGLMTGLSGIGHTLLRCAAPNAVPSLTFLDSLNERHLRLYSHLELAISQVASIS